MKMRANNSGDQSTTCATCGAETATDNPQHEDWCPQGTQYPGRPT